MVAYSGAQRNVAALRRPLAGPRSKKNHVAQCCGAELQSLLVSVMHNIDSAIILPGHEQAYITRHCNLEPTKGRQTLAAAATAIASPSRCLADYYCHPLQIPLHPDRLHRPPILAFDGWWLAWAESGSAVDRTGHRLVCSEKENEMSSNPTPLRALHPLSLSDEGPAPRGPTEPPSRSRGPSSPPGPLALDGGPLPIE
jgi:hypothetical protein